MSYPNNNTLNINSALPSPTSPSSPSEVASYLLTRSNNKNLKSIQPLSLNGNNTLSPVTLAGTGGIGGGTGGGIGPELAIEIEFDQLWENSQEEMILILGDDNKIVKDSMGVDDDNAGKRKIEGDEWPLSDEDVLAMRRERERCFTFLE